MSEEILIRQGAPTLAGIKAGSLFPCPCDDREALLDDVRRLNRLLAPKGLCLLPIRFKGGQALLYLYRPAVLHRGRLFLRRLRALRGPADPPLPGERGVSPRGGAVPQLSARGRAGLYRPPCLRFQVRGAVEGVQ